MQLLNERQYEIAREPLAAVSFNHLFARAVIENSVTGRVFADDILTPSVFYVVHPYGLSLLFGDADNETFLRDFARYATCATGVRARPEWMQVFPETLNRNLRTLLGSRIDTPDRRARACDGFACGDTPVPVIEVHTRVNFVFNERKYRSLASTGQQGDFQIVPVDNTLFETMAGTVIARHFWNNAREFLSRGIGFALLKDGRLASSAFCAFVHDRYLELGIETAAPHQGKGYAVAVCAALIDWALLRGFEPVWSCRLDNIGSFRLAEKLGFEPVRQIPFYKLPARDGL